MAYCSAPRKVGELPYVSLTVVRCRRDVKELAFSQLENPPIVESGRRCAGQNKANVLDRQRVAPTLGATCSLHFQPGSYVARPMVMPPRCTSSNCSFSISPTSFCG